MKRLMTVVLIAMLLLCSCAPEEGVQLPDPVAEAQKILGEKKAGGELYTAEDIADALLNAAPGAAEQEVLDAVLLPTSLGITLPKLNIKKVWGHREVLLSNYTNAEVFLQELKDQGYAEIDPTAMSYQEYRLLEKSWPLSDEELLQLGDYTGDEDITQWTKGDLLAYEEQQEWEALLATVTEEQKAALNARNILLEDLQILLEEYPDVETVLQKNDAELKEYLEDHYYIDLEFYLGDDVSEDLLENN